METVKVDITEAPEKVGIFRDDKIIDNGDGTITVWLIKPVKAGKDLIENVTMREPTVADAESADSVKGAIKQSQHMLAAVVGVPVAGIRALTLRDFNRLASVMAHFTGKTDPDGDDG